MSKIAIRAENLGKEFAIGRTPNHHPTLRDFIMQAAKEPFLRLGNVLRGQGAQNLSGDVLGPQEYFLRGGSRHRHRRHWPQWFGQEHAAEDPVAHHDPNEGFADLHGRVGSLLEVGTGFHPDLTGRENIFMNGCMLGMRRREISSASTKSSHFPKWRNSSTRRSSITPAACTCDWPLPWPRISIRRF